MGINRSRKELAILYMLQVIGTSLNRHFIYLRMKHKTFSFKPPEVLAALYIARDEKDGDRNLQLTCKLEGMGVVVAISIVKSQHQWGAPVTHLVRLLWRIEFFKSLF